MTAAVDSALHCKSSPKSHVALIYAVFFASALFVYHVVSDGNFSGVLTLSAMAQSLAFVLLLIQVNLCGSASGISARGLALDAMALCCRLSSTTWLHGYLPYDASGDYLYQLTDIFSLTITLWLLYQVLRVKRHTYDEHEDTFPILPLVVASLVLGMALHADLNARPLFDALWMTSVFIGAFAAIPQLSLIARAGGLAEALTTHHVAALGLSRILSGIFMWQQGEDLTCQPWIPGINHAEMAVLGVHFIHLLLLADFLYFYFTCMVRDGLHIRFKLEGAEYV